MASAMSPWRAGYGMLEPFRKEMEGLMQQFFGEEGGNGLAAAARAWAPRVDMEETDKEIVVKADLPGVDPKAIEVSVENGVLTIRGEKKEEKEKKEKNFYRMERFTGAFYRAIPLPEGTDAEKVSAASSNGVVTITIPKKPESQPKKITVTPKS